MAEQPTVSAPDPDAAISVRDLVRDYRRPRTSLRGPAPSVRALRGVSFDVAKGEHFGIVGESGCGKSTLLRIIAGLDRATSGTVMVDGRDITGLPDRRLGFLREHLQLVFQDPMGSLDPRMRVRDIVAEPLVAQGRGDHRERVVELLEAVGPEPRRRRPLSPTSSPGGSGSGSRSPAHSPPGRRSSWPTSRSAHSTSPSARRCST